MPRSTLMRPPATVAAAIAVTMLAGAAHGVISYDQNVTPEVIFGSGNVNGSFTVDRQNGVELGLRAKLRYPSSNIFNSNGDGTYTFNTGTGGGPPGNSEWSFEWTVNTDYNGSAPGRDVGDLTYSIGMDNDPSAETDYLVFDHVSIGTIIPYTAPAGPIPFWDHSMGDNTTANGAGVEAASGATYATYLATYNVAQNSWRPIFYQNTAPYGWDPAVPARYEYYVAAFDGALEVARTHITIIVVTGSSLTLEPEACQNDAHGAPGFQIAVPVYMRNLASFVTGFQAFLEFNPVQLDYRGDLSSYTAAPFENHITAIGAAETGLPAGELRIDGSADFFDPGTDQDSLLATLVFDVLIVDCSTTAVSFDLGQLPFKSEVSFMGVPLVTSLVNTGAMTVDNTTPMITCAAPIVVNADAGYCTAVLDFIETFDEDVVLSPTQAPGAWYTDRYPPAVFENALFGGDMRLRHGVNVADSQANRPPAYSSAFYNTQGRKYDIDMPVGTTLGADLHIGSDWTAAERSVGMWATTFDDVGGVSGFPIVNCLSDGLGSAKFRFFTQDTDQDLGNGYTAGYVDIGTVVNFNRWYRFEVKLTATAYEVRVIDLTGPTIVASFTDVLTFGSVRFGNVILQVYNFGLTYDAHWDNVTLGPAGPIVGDNCFGPLSLSYVRADDATLTLSDPFPTGTTRVTWTATDCAGNSASCNQNVTVNGFNDLSVMLTSPGAENTTRCIHVELDCGLAFADIPVTFDGSGLYSGILEIPCGDWDDVCVKDEQHTLWSSSSLSIFGPTYVADSAMTLEPGDTDNDSDVDINDVTWLLFQWSLAAADGGCPWNGTTRDADFDNSGFVGATDYALLSDNWLTFTTCTCLAPFGGGSTLPATSVLSSQFDPHVAARADLNRDGVIDFRDVQMFERTNGLPDTLSTAILQTELRGRRK